jgi:hypothetical protein
LKVELEDNIENLKSQISKYMSSYEKNNSVLSLVYDPLASLLSNVRGSFAVLFSDVDVVMFVFVNVVVGCNGRECW